MQKKVLIDIKDNNLFDYEMPDDIPDGAVVAVPFKGGTKLGVVTALPIDKDIPAEKMKSVTDWLNRWVVSGDTMLFMRRFADYNMVSLGQVLKMFIPTGVWKKARTVLQNPELKKIPLSDEQKAAVAALELDGFKVNVINGVTGSGKTEVYFAAIDAVLKRGRQVFVMLPEIALSSQFKKRFTDRFGTDAMIWHSEIGLKEKKTIWQSVIEGKARIVAGARSGLFLPFPELGLIVVDEEHEQSYKQEDGIVYQARDMAVLRAYCADSPIILCSATPSLETAANVINGKYKEIKIASRFGGASLPKVGTVDLRYCDTVKLKNGASSGLSLVLVDEIRKNLVSGEQTLLFLNRRGYAPVSLCRSCGEKVVCPRCSVSLVFHKEDGTHRCHLCGYKTRKIEQCPACHESGTIIEVGMGIEKLEEGIREIFPDAAVMTFSADNFNPKMADEVFQKVLDKKVDIMIGTQILAKGHHFPDLTLVGVIDADLGAEVDLRASERTYQLLEQVAGRAGRAAKPGRVWLQSYDMSNPVFKSLAAGDASAFLKREIESRKSLNMPPFGKMAAVIISGTNEDKAMEFAEAINRKAAYFATVAEILGPVPAVIFKLNGRFRYRFLVKTKRDIKIQKVLGDWLGDIKIPASLRVKIDIDPYNFM